MSSRDLAKVQIDDLALDSEEHAQMPDLEITFVDPRTGELETVTIPKEVFKVRVEETDDETMVILELENTKDKLKKDDDPLSLITHFPPSNRLH